MWGGRFGTGDGRLPAAAGGLRKEVHAIEQILEALVLAELVEPGVYAEREHGRVAQAVCLLEPFERSIGLAHLCVERRHVVSGDPAVPRHVARARSSLAQIAGGKLPQEEYDDLAGRDWANAGDDNAGYDLGYGESDPTPVVPPGASHGPGVPAPLAVIEHDDYGGLRAEVFGFERTAGGTLTLKLGVVNDTGGEVSLIAGNLFGQGPHTWNLREVGLIDPATGQRYTVITDSDGNVLTSAGGHGNRMLAVGERRELWARFAALRQR